MSCDAEAGRVLPTSIQEISGVGYFSKSSLSFLDASDDGERFVQAGRIVRLRLEVEIGMKLYPNDELVLALPDFMLTATSSDLVNASSINETSLPFYVSIRPASREVVLTSTAELEASTSLTFVLPSRLEIALPERGVAPNQADLTLEARSPSRPVAATPLDTVQAVGAFLNASLTFDPPVAGSKADLYLNFTCAMEILENESITLRLPDFSSNLSSTILQDAIKGVLVKATWDGETNQLTLVYLNQTRRNQAFEFKVLQMFVLPRLGVRKFSNNISISTEAQLGPAILHNFVDGVGYLSDTVLRAIPPRAGSRTELEISFVVHMTLSPGDTLQVTLPDYILSGVQEAAFSSANHSWKILRDGDLIRMQLSGSFEVQPNSQVSISISDSIGIEVLVKNETFPTMQYPTIEVSKCTDGRVLSRHFDSFPHIFVMGQFQNSILSFNMSDVKANEAGDICVNFFPIMTLSVNDQIILRFPGFYGESSQNVSFNCRPAEVIRSISWHQAAQEVAMILGREYDGEIHVCILKESLIHLPQRGVRKNDASFRMRSNAVAGPVMDQGIQHVEPVGAIKYSTISFRQASSNAVSINVNGAFWMDLAASDLLKIYVHEMSLSGAIVFVQAVGNPERPANSTWMQDCYCLSIELSEAIAAETTVFIRIEGNFDLPSTGITANQAGWRVAVQSPNGNVLPTSFMHVEPIGHIDVEMFIMNSTSTLRSVEMHFYMKLERFEKVILVIKGFSGNATYCQYVPSLPENVMSTIIWNSTAEQLVFIAEKEIEAGTQVSVDLSSLGLTSPPRDSILGCCQVFSAAVAGPVNFLPIQVTFRSNVWMGTTALVQSSSSSTAFLSTETTPTPFSSEVSTTVSESNVLMTGTQWTETSLAQSSSSSTPLATGTTSAPFPLEDSNSSESTTLALSSSSSMPESTPLPLIIDESPAVTQLDVTMSIDRHVVLKLIWKPDGEISSNSNASLFLQGVSNKSSLRIMVETLNCSANISGTYEIESKDYHFLFPCPVSLGTKISISVSDISFLAPGLNVTLLEARLTATIHYADGNTRPREYVFPSKNIGNIQSHLSFVTSQSFVVNMLPNFHLTTNDTLFIKLGGFLGHCQGDLLPHLSFDPSVFNLSSAVCNTSDSSVTLSLQVESDVPKGTSMSVTVSKSAGIELPAGGLTTSADFDRVTIRAEAKGALVLETPFLWTGGSIQRVGTLQQSSIRFDSTACSSADVSGISRSCIRAGSTVSVKVSFTASMPFRANESFTLCMPGFRGPENVSYVTLINSTVAIRNNRGLWDPTGCDGAASLSFEYLDGIAANVQSCVAISAGAGIRLPALG
eukprot:764273-Hanusia_phi.AAC.1